jgi:hypothetical protein
MDKRPNSFVFFPRLRYQLTVAPIFFCVLGLRTSSSTMWNNHAIHVIRIAGLGPAFIVRFSFLNPITVAVCRRARNAGKFLCRYKRRVGVPVYPSPRCTARPRFLLLNRSSLSVPCCSTGLWLDRTLLSDEHGNGSLPRGRPNESYGDLDAAGHCGHTVRLPSWNWQDQNRATFFLPAWTGSQIESKWYRTTDGPSICNKSMLGDVQVSTYWWRSVSFVQSIQRTCLICWPNSVMHTHTPVANKIILNS